MRRKLAAGNWKMNGLRADLAEIEAISAAMGLSPDPAARAEVLLCPPSTLLMNAADIAQGRVAIGGQNCHRLPFGPHTGDISGPMLIDAGASHVILGHSERRMDHRETDAKVREKALYAHSIGLVTVICLGETAEDHDLGQTVRIVGRHLQHSLPEDATAANTVVAYEPIWAIGSGKTPTPAQIAEVHGFMRTQLIERFGAEGEGMRLLYGGSVKPGNAAEIFAVPEVDGALVGGASLTARDFLPIVEALERS
ncbi:triose-phosphate isomerase [Paenirhodobacter enshiensis]|uniref:triose-phosphate isomerase n=1 Tax=Paenirhodobacter enshiensis TaxID=1105367 RepID=UPI0035B253EF